MPFATFNNYQGKKNVETGLSFTLVTNRGLLGVRSPLDEVFQYTSGSKQVSFGVLNQSTRVILSEAGSFLSELRFESQVQKSQVFELIDHT